MPRQTCNSSLFALASSRRVVAYKGDTQATLAISAVLSYNIKYALATIQIQSVDRPVSHLITSQRQLAALSIMQQ